MSVLLRGVLEKRSREGEWKPQTFEVRSDHKLSYYAGGGLSRTLDFADVLKIERKNTTTLILWMDGSSRHQLRRPEEAPATGPSLDDFERECRRAHGAATAAARAPGKPRPPRTPAAVKAATPMSRGRRTVTFRSPTADDAPATPEAPATREDVASLRESAEKGFERLLSRSASPRVDADAVGSVAAARTRRVATEKLVQQALKVHEEEQKRVSPAARRELAKEHDAELDALETILSPQIARARAELEAASASTPDSGASEASSMCLTFAAESLGRARAAAEHPSPQSSESSETEAARAGLPSSFALDDATPDGSVDLPPPRNVVGKSARKPDPVARERRLRDAAVAARVELKSSTRLQCARN